MHRLALVSIATTALLAPIGSAHAVVITLGSTQYDITTVTTSYNASQALLQSQPWWGDTTAAAEASLAITDSLGLNMMALGPAFAYEAVTGPFVTTVNTRRYYLIASFVVDLPNPAESDDVYAVATRVHGTGVPDGGTTGPLLALGLGGLALLRCRVSRP